MLFLLLKLVGAFFAILLIGKLIRSFTKWSTTEGFTGFFADVGLGFYSAVSLYAMVKTGGITISSLWFVWVLITAWVLNAFSKPNFTPFTQWPRFVLTEIAVVIALLFAWNYWKYFPDGYDSAAVINWDALSDVTRSIFLKYTGIENSNTNFIQLPSGSQPYHYFEAWSVSFFATVTQTNFWITQGLIFHPIILLISYAGFRSLTRHQGFSVPLVLTGILLFFTSSVLTPEIQKISFFEWTGPLRNNLMDEPWWTRLSVLYPVIMLAGLAMQQQHIKAAILVLLSIPFLSVTPAIPIISTSFGLLFLGNVFVRKKLNLAWGWLAFPVCAAVLYQVFYIVFKDTSEFIDMPKISDILLELSQFSAIKSKVITIIEKITQTLILFAPIWMVILALQGKKLKPGYWLKNWSTPTGLSLIFIITIALVSLAMWQVLNFVFGASFFYYYTLLPFINIFLVYTLWESLQQHKQTVKMAGYVYLLILGFFWVNRSMQIHETAQQTYFTAQYSPQFINQVNNYCTENQLINGLQLGVKIEAVSEIKHPFFNDGLSLCGYYVYGIMDAPALVSLTRAEIPDSILNEKKFYKTFTKHAPFYIFAEQNKAIDQPEQLDSLKLAFIQQHAIRYAVVSPRGVVPASLIARIDTTFEDPISGERFIAFKPTDL